MNDKELADKVVALELDGLHGRYAHKAGNREWFTYARDMEAKEFVRDWRVAGALMEKCCFHKYGTAQFQDGSTDNYTATVEKSKYSHWSLAENESLPRAIIEACVEALDD